MSQTAEAFGQNGGQLHERMGLLGPLKKEKESIEEKYSENV